MHQAVATRACKLQDPIRQVDALFQRFSAALTGLDRDSWPVKAVIFDLTWINSRAHKKYRSEHDSSYVHQMISCYWHFGCASKLAPTSAQSAVTVLFKLELVQSEKCAATAVSTTAAAPNLYSLVICQSAAIKTLQIHTHVWPHLVTSAATIHLALFPGAHM
jgi:hypothetical protein